VNVPVASTQPPSTGAVRGWCPDVADPLVALDGPLVRITVPGGILSAVDAELIAGVADLHGNGVIELTSRANVQLRGVRGHDPAMAMLVQAGLTSGRPSGDRSRAVLASPTAGLDANERFDTRPMVTALVTELAARHDLGPKFSVLVDGGGAVHCRDRRATERRVPADLPSTPCAPPLGVVAARQPGQVWIGAAPLLGRLTPMVLASIAGIARRHGDGDVRVTPWRGLVLGGIAVADAERCRRLLAEHDLALHADDPRLSVIACAGSGGCAASLGDVQGDARRLVARRQSPRGATEQGARPSLVHLSGCDKRCASRDDRVTTFVADGIGRYRRIDSGATR
jgi:precorrin-3B synthase